MARAEELLACLIARLIAEANHVAVGAASPIPATACELLRAQGRPLRVTRLHKRKGNTFSEERWTHTCRPKKALAVDEGSLGGATESSAQITDYYNRNRRLADSFRFEIRSLRIPKHCSREDSNLHGFPHTVLSRTRLPIPPREQNQ